MAPLAHISVINTSTRGTRVVQRIMAPSYGQPLPFEHDLHVADLAYVATFRPFHVEGAAVTHDAKAAVGDPLDDRGHRRAGGAGARGAGVADAAPPETHAQLGPRRAGDEPDVGAPREGGRAVQERPPAGPEP